MFDLNEWLSNLSNHLHALMGEDIETGIATSSDHALVKADPHQMEQVVMNLASNARDAMRHGGKFTLETKLVELEEKSPLLHRWMKAGEYAVLSIRDNGTGMDSDTQCHCFDPYFTTKEGHEGLGLTFVFGMVRSNGGDLSVRSDHGHGTTFTIYLPTAEQQSTPA